MDTPSDEVARDELLAQGDRLLEQSQRLIADLDDALRRGSTAVGSKSRGSKSREASRKDPLDLTDRAQSTT